MKNYCIRILFVCLIFALSVNVVSAVSSTGFVPGQIWYSKDTFVAGDTVKIYTVVWNAGPNPLSVRVEFYDKTIVLGARDVVVEKEKLEQVSIPWNIATGDHAISAKIISSTIDTSGKKESIILDNRTTAEDVIFVSASKNNKKSNDDSISSSKDPLKNSFVDLEKKINETIPPSISRPILKFFSKTEQFRDSTHKKILKLKADIQKKIDALAHGGKSNPSGVGEPIVRLKIFSLSICAFIFATRLVFYGLSFFLFITILRFFYHKLRDK